MSGPRMVRLGAALAAQEAIIERGQRTFVEVGNALARIRDERLYEEPGFTSFDAYCKERWGWNRTRAEQLISSADTAASLEAVTTVTPANERQARALRQVPEDQRVEVWERVQEAAEETGEPITAARIREAAGGPSPKAKPKCAHCEVHCPRGHYSRRENQ